MARRLTPLQRNMLMQVQMGKVQRHQTGAGIEWIIAEAKASGTERRALDALAQQELIKLHGFGGGSHSPVTAPETP